ncbi:MULTISPECIES: type II toxin-antitoxin system Phd/YefM family antitoxin [unclassified Adlercreutzia]|uniref:type II toxin-antitoxin system Phd/YefM family antitoxin n=1 Tax=unclassified Adlercreutzia TaxID=2636013 RepID=UPI0013ED9CF5|nr:MULTISPECIES: type II toxin-antitoxin system prevent-host-death family antitoxin [unclassified Adlercreutzia]
MRTITYSNFRKDLKSEIQRCRDNAESLLVTNRDETENVVVMNARDYDSLMETIRIYENPELHNKILRGLQQIRSGNGIQQELLNA